MPLHRLVRLIESHSKELASELLNRAHQSPHLTSFGKAPDHELRLMTRTEGDIARQYAEIGARRYRRRVALSELLWALMLTKEYLWDFLGMFRRIDHFFNRTMYYAARGFEQAERAQKALATAAS